MNIPITTTLGFLGLASLAVGLFLFLSGLEIFKITQVTVMPGKKTWGAGLIFALVGVALLMPEVLKNRQPSSGEIGSETPLPTTTAIAGTVQSPTIDVPDPLGADVLEFVNSIQFTIEPKGSISKISGIWNSTWCCRQGDVWVTGTATILLSEGDWIHIIQEDTDGGQYVIKAKLMDNRLVGRYINVNVESDTHPWVGILVDDNRIDGMWKYEAGKEWNFSRNP